MSPASYKYKPAGLHILADFQQVPAALLNRQEAIEAVLIKSAQQANACVLSSHFHSFGEGSGITGVVVLAESHISIHTWPEAGFAAVDIFMCGNTQPQLALETLQQHFHPAPCITHMLYRGQQSVNDPYSNSDNGFNRAFT